MTEILFLHSACRLMLFDICIKFHEYGLSRQFCEYSLKSISNRVTILALCMSTHVV